MFCNFENMMFDVQHIQGPAHNTNPSEPTCHGCIVEAELDGSSLSSCLEHGMTACCTSCLHEISNYLPSIPCKVALQSYISLYQTTFGDQWDFVYLISSTGRASHTGDVIRVMAYWFGLWLWVVVVVVVGGGDVFVVFGI